MRMREYIVSTALYVVTSSPGTWLAMCRRSGKPCTEGGGRWGNGGAAAAAAGRQRTGRGSRGAGRDGMVAAEERLRRGAGAAGSNGAGAGARGGAHRQPCCRRGAGKRWHQPGTPRGSQRCSPRPSAGPWPFQHAVPPGSPQAHVPLLLLGSRARGGAAAMAIQASGDSRVPTHDKTEP